MHNVYRIIPLIVFGSMVQINTLQAACPNDGNNCSQTVSTGDNYSGSVVAGGSTTLTSDATNNTLTMTGGSIGIDAYGGQSNTGSALNNIVRISGGIVGNDVIGGQSASQSAENNQIFLSGGNVTRYVTGGHSTSGTANRNIVTISNGTVGNHVYGGYGITAANNNVILQGGTITLHIYGGLSTAGEAVQNNVSVSGGQAHQIIGGYGTTGSSFNTVTISGTGLITNNVAGGLTDSNSSHDNNVSVEGGTVNGSVAGGQSRNGTAENNKATIKAGTVHGSFIGGAANVAVNNNHVEISGSATIDGNAIGGGGQGTNTTASGNSLIMSGGHVLGDLAGGKANSLVSGNNVSLSSGQVDGSVYGGDSLNDDANSNIVQITGGTVDIYVFGGHSTSGGANDNIVTISNGTVGQNVYGGYGPATITGNHVAQSGGTIGHIYGGTSTAGEAVQNSVSVSGGQALQIIGGFGATGSSFNTVTISGTSLITNDVAGGTTNTNISHNNIVSVEGGMINGSVVGGLSHNGTAENNKATIKAGTVADGFLGGAGVAANKNIVEISGSATIGKNAIGGGGQGAGATASDNSLTMSGGHVVGDIIGGRADGLVSRNDVTLSGGQVDGSAYGGFSISKDASNNNVSIDEALIRTDVYGGYSTAGGITTYNTVTLRGGQIIGGVFGGNNTDKTGNTLNLHGYLGSVREINNFANYSVILSDTVANGMTQVHITGATPTDLSGAQVTNFQFAPGATHYQPGDRMNIIDFATHDGSFKDTTFTAVPKGISAVYDVLVSGDGGAFTANILGKKTAPYSENFNRHRLGGLAVLGHGADLLTQNGIDQAWNSQVCENSLSSLSGFAAVDYADYGFGRGLDVNSWSFITGLAWKDRQSCNSGLLAALFFEAGKGNHDNKHVYEGYGAVNYHGDIENYGIGTLFRYRFENRFRLEGSARFGRQNTEYQALDYPSGDKPHYDLNSNYLGLHVAAGYDIDLAEKWNLDMSAMYQWIRLGGKTTEILGEEVGFKPAHSHIIRASTRLNYQMTPHIKPFVKASYEYEFDGMASSHNYTVNLVNQHYDIEGGSALGELGVAIVPDLNQAMLLEVAVKGSAGKREGVGGRLNFKWDF